MKPILIFRHTASEGPGYFGDYLNKRNISYQVICVDTGEPVPTRCDKASALVFMGGPMSVNDDLPWIAPELALIRQAINHNMPVLGHCLGGQLISKALGGTISANPVKEFGWLDVKQQHNRAANEWLGALPPRFSAFHWHGETFSIPPGATNILASEHCPHQGFVTGNTLALQCHVEMTAELVRLWAQLHPDDIAVATPSIQTVEQMTENLDERITVLQDTADKLYDAWLKRICS